MASTLVKIKIHSPFKKSSNSATKSLAVDPLLVKDDSPVGIIHSPVQKPKDDVRPLDEFQLVPETNQDSDSCIVLPVDQDIHIASSSQPEIIRYTTDRLVKSPDTPSQKTPEYYQRKEIYEAFVDALRKLTDLASMGSHDIEEDHPLLTDLCQCLNKVLHHGFQVKKSWLKQKTPWSFIEDTLRKKNQPALTDLITTVTHLGQGMDGWIKLGLIQQKLGHSLEILLSDKHLLAQSYEEYAIIRHEDHMIPIVGMITGLSLLEFNFCLKPEKEMEDKPIKETLVEKPPLPPTSKPSFFASIKERTLEKETIEQLKRTQTTLLSQIQELEKSNQALLDDNQRLETSLSRMTLERDNAKSELGAALRQQAELSGQLERARLLGKTAKAELEKLRNTMQGGGRISRTSSSENP